jgi:spore coat protein U-like protein
MLHRLSAAGLAAVLVLSVAAPAFAGTINETLSVNSAISASGIPGTINYGTVDPGATSATQTIPFTVDANIAWKMLVSGSAFTSGTNTIPLTARYGKADAGSWIAFGTQPFDNAHPTFSGIAGSAQAHELDLRVQVPTAASPGTYTGTVTWTLAAN